MPIWKPKINRLWAQAEEEEEEIEELSAWERVWGRAKEELWERAPAQLAAAGLTGVLRGEFPYRELYSGVWTPEQEKAVLEEYKKWEPPRGVKGAIELGLEAPFFGAIPTAAAARAGLLARGGRAAQVAAKAIKPIAAAEAIPAKIIQKIAPKITKPDIVGDIVAKIKTWRIGVAGTKALRTPEYGRRFTEYTTLVDDFLKKSPGQFDRAAQYARGALKGKYPEATFEIPKFTRKDINNLRLYGHQQVVETAKDFGRLGPRIGMDQTNLDKAVVRVFLEKKPPREFELKLFERAFGDEFARTLSNIRRTLGQKAFSTYLDIANFPRAVLASFDVSAPLRQGAILFARAPLKGFQSMKTMFKALVSEKNAQLIDDVIRARPNTQLGLKSGLELTQRAGMQKGVGLRAMAAREESFMSRFAHLVPGIKMSERAYVTFLNDMRSRMWEGYVPLLQKLGASDRTYRGMASLINMASGRGEVGGLRYMTPLLNNIFFSPRLVLSRLQIPTMLVNRDPIVRKEAWKMFLSFMGMGTAVMSGFKLSGYDVGLDPRSGEFGKVKIGNTRLDFWAGFAQFGRFFSQFATAKRKLRGKGLTEANRKDLLIRMSQSKFAPMMGFLWDVLAGQTYMGEEVLPTEKGELAKQVRNRLAPLFIQDVWDAVEDAGPIGAAIALPGAFGVGVITYKGRFTPPKEYKPSPEAGAWGELGGVPSPTPSGTWEELGK